ncbi:SAF domain-containing protein [Pedobacter westerhofensis]|uniref:SAF domain-containing protein n=1 Tax=Pedobacter westerhofensis TaxID=425512 RepID=A0A521FS37_9SPHI|nr:UxaA family hydrolase [Pedobacter westerhofensis]SMO98894.1 SAF domain-containing protein [Pedobacter westerhofensis]
MDKLIKIHSLDNVMIVTADIQAGEHLHIRRTEYYFDKPVGIGHKVAAQFIESGGKIIKYGVPIGSATEDIQMGGHVHLHNMKSDYIPTYTYEKQYPGDANPSLTNQSINQVL